MTKEENEQDNQKPPILGSWRNIYILIIGVLIAQIVLYNFITITY